MSINLPLFILIYPPLHNSLRILFNELREMLLLDKINLNIDISLLSPTG